MNKVSKREAFIIELVEERGFASTEHLVSICGVTPQTIRRDINRLCAQNRLKRHHGGVSRISADQNDPYNARVQSMSAGKSAIGRLVSQSIDDGASLFINIGTTTECVAKALLAKSDLKIVTNNLNVANILAENKSFEISVAGGVLRKRDRGIVGHMATNFMSQFRMQFGIIGVSGIGLDGSLLDFDHRETETAKQIIQNSGTVFLVADHSKFGRGAVVRYGSLDNVDHLFTDREPPEEFQAALSASHVKVHVAETEFGARAET